MKKLLLLSALLVTTAAQAANIGALGVLYAQVVACIKKSSETGVPCVMTHPAEYWKQQALAKERQACLAAYRTVTPRITIADITRLEERQDPRIVAKAEIATQNDFPLLADGPLRTTILTYLKTAGIRNPVIVTGPTLYAAALGPRTLMVGALRNNNFFAFTMAHELNHMTAGDHSRDMCYKMFVEKYTRSEDERQMYKMIWHFESVVTEQLDILKSKPTTAQQQQDIEELQQMFREYMPVIRSHPYNKWARTKEQRADTVAAFSTTQEEHMAGILEFIKMCADHPNKNDSSSIHPHSCKRARYLIEMYKAKQTSYQAELVLIIEQAVNDFLKEHNILKE